MPDMSLTCREMFPLAGDNWQRWLSDTILDTYILYMKKTMDFSSRCMILNLQFLSFLFVHLMYPPSEAGGAHNAVNIYAEQEEAETDVSTTIKHKKNNKRTCGAGAKKAKVASAWENDKMFAEGIVEF